MTLTTPSGDSEVIRSMPGDGAGAPNTVGTDAVAPRTDFAPGESLTLLDHVRGLVEAAVLGRPAGERLAPALEEAPAYGLFLTLRRGSLLRACRGRWGDDGKRRTLGRLAAVVAHETALLDVRYPSINPEELPLLSIDLWVLHDPRWLSAAGEARAAAIEIGTHGLAVMHPRGSGVALPRAAVQQGWDARAFLEQTCIQAGLAPSTWREPACRVQTFRAGLLTAESPARELDPDPRDTAPLNQLLAAVNRLLSGRAYQGPGSDWLTERRDGEVGLHAMTADALAATALGSRQSVLDLASIAARTLRDLSDKRGGAAEPVSQAWLLSHPIRLRGADYPDRHRLLGCRAILARKGPRWTLSMKGKRRSMDCVADAVESLGVPVMSWAEGRDPEVTLTAFYAVHVKARKAAPAPPAVRPPAAAGRMYPADAGRLYEALDRYLSSGAGGSPRAVRGVIVPHGDWASVGDAIGRTLARVRVPRTVILLAPKQGDAGEPTCVPPHAAWSYGAGEVPVATGVVARLLAMVPCCLESDAEAHAEATAAETLLPFLHRLNPGVRVVPMVLSEVSYRSTEPLAAAMAQLLGESDDPPLLIAAMNLAGGGAGAALEAVRTGRADKLYAATRGQGVPLSEAVPAIALLQALEEHDPSRDVGVEVIEAVAGGPAGVLLA